MYSAFDALLKSGTWHAGHDLDDERFFKLLATVVQDPEFDPDKMGEHMKGQVNPAMHGSVDEFVTKAWTVRDYLSATGGR